jgi:hypothetical protein
MTEFNNPFLLLSSTKALNELVVNTNPSSRAKVANIEPTKSKYQQNPLGVPIDVYTKDTPTTPQVPKLKGSARLERNRASLKSEWATRVAAQKKRREERQKPKPKAKPTEKPKPKPKESKIYTTKPTKASERTEPKPKTTIGGGVQKEKAGGGKVGKKKVGAPNRGITAAKKAEADKKRVAKARDALARAGAGGI